MPGTLPARGRASLSEARAASSAREDTPSAAAAVQPPAALMARLDDGSIWPGIGELTVRITHAHVTVTCAGDGTRYAGGYPAGHHPDHHRRYSAAALIRLYHERRVSTAVPESLF